MRNKFISIYWYSLPCGGPGLDYSPEGKNRPMPLPACCKLLKGGWVCGQVAAVLSVIDNMLLQHLAYCAGQSSLKEFAMYGHPRQTVCMTVFTS